MSSISNNPIRSLKGIPKIIHSYLLIKETEIKNLEGIGKSVDTIYVTNKNKTEISLEYLPEKFNKIIIEKENKRTEYNDKEAKEVC